MDFKWLNESEIRTERDRIEITAPARTDFFCGGTDGCEEGILPESLCNAPFYYAEVEGDFVLKVNSDDANGCNLEGDTAWLQVCRVGNNFAFHYSLDGVCFYMMRYFHLPVMPVVKVGLLAQAPTGKGGKRIYEHLSIKHRTVKNIRAGK